MRVLVTGSSGFLGRSFVEYLITLGGEVDLWTIDNRPHPDGVPGTVDDLETFLNDFDEDVDLVIHCASPVGGREKIDNEPMYNADAFRLDSVMFRWAVKHAKGMVYPSSSAVYPVSLQGEFSQGRLSEDTFDPVDKLWGQPDQLYGLSKLVGENLAWKSAAYGLNTLCIRPFSGYGPGQDFDYPVPSIAARVLRMEDPLTIWGSSSQVRDFVYVTDLVKATFARLGAMVKGYQVMNIASGNGLSFRDLAVMMCSIVGYKPVIVGDLSKPVGVMRRVGDPTLMRSYYKHLEITPILGLRRVLLDVEKRLTILDEGVFQ